MCVAERLIAHRTLSNWQSDERCAPPSGSSLIAPRRLAQPVGPTVTMIGSAVSTRPIARRAAT
jgi:hypothetical protein